MIILSLIIGGSLGAMIRFYLSVNLPIVLGSQFPYHTLIVNIIGSFLIGICLVLLEKNIFF